MTVTVTFYKSFKDYLGDGAINLNTASLLAIPLTSAYALNQAHDFADDLTNEVTANLATGRPALGTQSWALSGDNGRFDCDDVVWTASGGSATIRKFAVANDTGAPGADSGRELVCLVENDADLTAADGFDIAFLTPSGLFEIQ